MIPLFHCTVGIEFWQLLALVFLGALLDGPGMTARMALYPELVQRTSMSLDKANAGYQTTRRVAGVLGPPLSGVLIASIGAVALEPINPMTMSIMQEQVPAGMRGRVFGANSAIQGSTLPIGILVFGFLMESLGLQPTLVIFVVVNCALPIGMALLPPLRDIQRPA